MPPCSIFSLADPLRELAKSGEEGAPAIARADDQSAVAGKHVVGLRRFRPSSQDGQYQPWGPGGETLRLASFESDVPPGQRTPSPKHPIAPTKSSEELARRHSQVAPSSVKPEPSHSASPAGRPALMCTPPKPDKGWRDDTPEKAPQARDGGSPVASVVAWVE